MEDLIDDLKNLNIDKKITTTPPDIEELINTLKRIDIDANRGYQGQDDDK